MFKGKILVGIVYLVVCLSSLLMVLFRLVGNVVGMIEILIILLYDFYFNLSKKIKVDFSIIFIFIRYNEIGLYIGLMFESIFYI